MIFANCNFGNTAKSIVRRRLHRQHCALARVVVVVKSRRQKSSSKVVSRAALAQKVVVVATEEEEEEEEVFFIMSLLCVFFSRGKAPSFFLLHCKDDFDALRVLLLLRSAQPRETATTTTRSGGRRKDHRILVSRGRLNTYECSSRPGWSPLHLLRRRGDHHPHGRMDDTNNGPNSRRDVVTRRLCLL